MNITVRNVLDSFLIIQLNVPFKIISLLSRRANQ